MKHKIDNRTIRGKERLHAPVAAAMLAMVASPAYAQLEKVTSKLTALQVFLITASLTIITIAIMWAGMRMSYQHAKWADISHAFYGAVITGAAPGLAAWLLG
jgi:type IV secretion system protein VirB2